MGVVRWMMVVSRPAPEGTIVGLADIDNEVNERRARESAEERYRLIIENESDVVVRADLDGVVTWISPSITELTGFKPEDIVGHRICDYVHPDEMVHFALMISKVVGGEKSELLARMLLADGSYRWMSSRYHPLLDEKGAPSGMVVNFREVNDEAIARLALAESEKRFRLAMESAPIGMAVEDLDRRFLLVNSKLGEMVGHGVEWLLEHRVPEVLEPEDDIVDLRHRAEIVAGTLPIEAWECRLQRDDCEPVWVEHSIGLLRDEAGAPLSYVSTYVDVTESKKAKESLTYQATHDLLTHLTNRRDLFNQADKVMGRVERTGAMVAALYVDVDHLKSINDNYGHAAGDQALVAIAHRLTSACRSNDIVSRVGGDEFAILLPGLHSISDAEAVADKILGALVDPVAIDGSMIPLSVSIGIALAGSNESAEETLRHADTALYHAKEEGRGRAASYRTPSMTR